MSVVATKIYDTYIEIAADSQVTLGWTAFKDDKSVKLSQSENGLIIGSVGGAATHSLMKVFTKNHYPKDASEDGLADFLHEFDEWVGDHSNGVETKDQDWHILYRGKAFLVSNYYIQQITTYHAIGSGMDYALAALYFGKSPTEAVQAAIDLNIYCCAPITTLKMRR